MAQRQLSRHVPTRITIEEILADASASKAFDKLCAHGADRKVLATLVQVTVLAREFRKFDPLFVSGFGRETLNKFPTTIREVATKIESVFKNPYLEPQPLPDSNFQSLPGKLRAYANKLEATIKQYRQSLKTSPRFFDMQVVLRRKLLHYVAKTTGQPHYAWVASVLSGAPMLGTSEPVVDPSTLRKLYANRRRAKRSQAKYKQDFLAVYPRRVLPHLDGSL